MDLTLRDIASVLHIDSHQEGSTTVRGASTDTRTLKGGMLFFALRGECFDGHDYVTEALEKGACAAVVEEKWAPANASVEDRILPVLDPLRALQDVASFYRAQFSFPVIAVTGTNGKTTTKEMIASILSLKYRVVKSEGNLNNHIGLPLNICAWEKVAEVAVLEMGMNHLGEIERLCEIAQPTHGVITNIGKGHLEFLGDEEGVLEAKAELLTSLNKEGQAFLNGDDDRLFSVRDAVEKTSLFGFSDRCDFRAEEAGSDEWGHPAMRLDGEIVRIPVPGRHSLMNGLAAACVARAFRLSFQEIKKGLESYRPIGKRMEVFTVSGVTIINDAYNANPSSVREALATLGSMRQIKRKIAVLGDMLELGERSAEEHERIGEWLVEMEYDALFAFGKEMKQTVQRARAQGLNAVEHFESKEDLVNALHAYLREEDGLLVKGSRGMRMEEVVEALRMHYGH